MKQKKQKFGQDLLKLMKATFDLHGSDEKDEEVQE